MVWLALMPLPCLADWTEVGKSVRGDTYFVDFDRIRRHGDSVYWWGMNDNAQPTKFGVLSAIVYFEGDCKVFRYKYLSDTYYLDQMGKGKISSHSNTPDEDWTYPKRKSVFELVLKKVCDN